MCIRDREDSDRRQQEFKEKTENFVKNLELDETLGQLLVAEGYSTIDDIKDTTSENLIKIEGIEACLLYTSPSPRDGLLSRMPSSA